MADLIPGYALRRHGVSSYAGVLKPDRKSEAVWRCTHDHLTTVKARQCADAELERRTQGGRQVLVLLHCEPCDQWLTPAYLLAKLPAVSQDGTRCPYCGVPLERVRLAVLERGPA